MPPAPFCSCHGVRACVHGYGGNPARRLAGGHGEGHGWEWHCAADAKGCEGYSVVLILAEEWLTDDEREWLAGFRSRSPA